MVWPAFLSSITRAMDLIEALKKATNFIRASEICIEHGDRLGRARAKEGGYTRAERR